MALGVFFFPSFIANFLYKNYKHACNDEEFMAEYESLIGEVRVETSQHSMMFYPLFMLQRAFFALVIVLFEGLPGVQLLLCAGLCAVSLAYMLVYKPFQDGYTLLNHINAEVLLLGSLGTFGLLLYNFSDENKAIIGWGLIGYTCAVIVSTWIVIGIQQYQTCKKAKQSSPAEAVTGNTAPVKPGKTTHTNVRKHQARTFRPEKKARKPIT